jgi:hypothetical protein
MSERIVDDPANHGWVEENGKWVWEGGSTTGHIEDGTVQGQITTWDVAKTEWTPTSTMLVDDTTGDATFSNGVNASYFFNAATGFGFRFGSRNNVQHFFPVDVDGGILDGVADLGFDDTVVKKRWRNGYFTGQVIAGDTKITETGKIWQDGHCGIGMSTIGGSGIETLCMIPLNAAGSAQINTGFMDIGRSNYPFRDGYFAGNVTSGDFRSDRGDGTGALYFGSADTHYLYYDGTRYLFNLDPVHAGDFVATSDERVKDNITTAPVGLIDSLKGREWDWAESGEKGSGVVAQELEEVLPHLVHEDDEGMKSVAYNGLVAYLIEEVKALKAEVEALKNG